VRSLVAVAILLASASARADTGQVVASRTYWRGDRIVTESTLRLADGSQRVILQPGGTVDGIGMRVIPSEPLLRPGDQADVELAGPWLRRVRALTPGALPFVRTTNDFGTPLKWASGCVFVTYDAAGTTHVEGTSEFAVMDAVFAQWRGDTDQCSYLEFDIGDPVEHETTFDRTNIIKFREDRWCRPAIGDEPEECYNPDAAALTTLYFVEDEDSDRDGEILDADIEMNAVNFAISVDGATLGGPSCDADLAGTLTHEVGHLIGLDHTCWTNTGTRPVDDQGNPVPSCLGILPPEITEATMYNFQECGETKKSSPEADDVAGVCAIYPIAEDPMSCEPVPPPKDGCCSTGGGPGGALLAPLVLLLISRRGARRRADRGVRCSAPR
jgi:hypothetical protein